MLRIIFYITYASAMALAILYTYIALYGILFVHGTIFNNIQSMIYPSFCIMIIASAFFRLTYKAWALITFSIVTGYHTFLAIPEFLSALDSKSFTLQTHFSGIAILFIFSMISVGGILTSALMLRAASRGGQR